MRARREPGDHGERARAGWRRAGKDDDDDGRGFGDDRAYLRRRKCRPALVEHLALWHQWRRRGRRSNSEGKEVREKRKGGRERRVSFRRWTDDFSEGPERSSKKTFRALRTSTRAFSETQRGGAPSEREREKSLPLSPSSSSSSSSTLKNKTTTKNSPT